MHHLVDEVFRPIFLFRRAIVAFNKGALQEISKRDAFYVLSLKMIN